MLQCAPLLRIVYLHVDERRQRRQSSVPGVPRLGPLPTERQREEPSGDETRPLPGGTVLVEGTTEAVHRTPPRQARAPPGTGRRIAGGDRRRRRDQLPRAEATRRGDDGRPESAARATPRRHQRLVPAARGRETGADAGSTRPVAAPQHRVDEPQPLAHKHGGRLEAVSPLHPDNGERDGQYAVPAVLLSRQQFRLTSRGAASCWQSAASAREREHCIASPAS